MDTFIARGVRLTAGRLEMLTDASTSAKTYITAGSVGGYAIGVNAAVAILSPTVLTYIGATPEGFDAAQGASSATPGQITVTNDLVIKNNILNSNALSTVLSLSAGAASVNGNVLLVFNQTNGIAGISRANVAAGNIAIDANNTVKAESFLASATLGINVAVGISVSYVHLRSDNRAIIDTTGVTVSANTIEVYAGREGAENSAEAIAESVAGNVGSISLGNKRRRCRQRRAQHRFHLRKRQPDRPQRAADPRQRQGHGTRGDGRHGHRRHRHGGGFGGGRRAAQ